MCVVLIHVRLNLLNSAGTSVIFGKIFNRWKIRVLNFSLLLGHPPIEEERDQEITTRHKPPPKMQGINATRTDSDVQHWCETIVRLSRVSP